MRWAFGAISIVLVAAACGSASEKARELPRIGDTTVNGGSRLRPRFLATDDGARELVGWFDNARNDDCAFDVAEDTRVRCLPTPAFYVDGFGDDQCSTRIAERNPVVLECPRPKEARYAVETVRQPCAARRVFPADGTFATFPICRSNDDTSCMCFPNQRQGTRVGAVIAPTEFVEATFTLGGNARIAARMRVTQDGAREWVGWYDTTLGASCQLIKRDATTAMCVPRATGSRTMSISPDCNGGEDSNAVEPPCDGELDRFPQTRCLRDDEPSEARFFVDGICSETKDVRRIEGHVGGRYAFQASKVGPGSCGEVDACGLGPPIELATVSLLDPAMVGNLRSGTRLTAYVAGFGECFDALPRERARWRDTQLDADCEFGEATDGTTRCFPFDGDVRDKRYADAECTKALVGNTSRDLLGEGAWLSLPNDDDPARDPCRPTRIAYRVSERVPEGTPTFIRNHAKNLQCEPYGASRADDWLLTRVDPNELASAKLVTE